SQLHSARRGLPASLLLLAVPTSRRRFVWQRLKFSTKFPVLERDVPPATGLTGFPRCHPVFCAQTSAASSQPRQVPGAAHGRENSGGAAYDEPAERSDYRTRFQICVFPSSENPT